jgi:SAM-dependent methyltransferase
MIKPLILRSPKFDHESITVPAEAADLSTPFSGTICSRKGDEYEISTNIIDLLGKRLEIKSLAQLSNEWSVTATIYEEYWRKNAVSLLSGQEFPLEKEKRLLQEWVKPEKGKLYLDIGCSTALYSRFVAGREKDATVVALDYSKPMLRKAREKAKKQTLNFYLLRADAHKMPFFQSTFDGLLSGGTLNELTDPVKVLYEAHRILKVGGSFFLMYLLKGENWYERILQESTKLGGITFWTQKEINEKFRQTGFKIIDQVRHGWVAFTLLQAS